MKRLRYHEVQSPNYISACQCKIWINHIKKYFKITLLLTGQNYVTDSVRYRLQHQPLDVVGCGVRN